MFTINETNNIDYNTYWELIPQKDWSEDELRNKNIQYESEIYVSAPKEGEWGETRNNTPYNQEIYKLLNKPQLKILDIGCGGGGFVEECIKDGHIALGLDIGEAYQRLKSFSWKTIPENLFIRDIGQPLEIKWNNELIQFDFIHSWDCFEHIKTEDMSVVCQNIVNHSHINTLIILQIANWKGYAHRNVHSRESWSEFFRIFNLIEYPRCLANNFREEQGEHIFFLRTVS